MKISYSKILLNDLKQIKNRNLKNDVIAIFDEIKSTNSVSDIHECIMLEGYSDYFRIRIGNYRLGCKILSRDKVLIICFKHRSEIYKEFP